MSGFTPEFQSALDQFMAASPGAITINSGYRSPERQAVLYEQAIAKYGSPEAARKWVAPPGNSQHNFGRAADLGYASPEVQAWAHENAAQYGLTFPMGYEPWHVEPIGARSGQPETPAAQPAITGKTDPMKGGNALAMGADKASGNLDKLALMNALGMFKQNEQQQPYNFLMQG